MIDSITIALCAAICGARSLEDVEDYGHSKRDWLKTFLWLPNGVPCQDTFQRVFARLNSQALQGYLLNWRRVLHEAIGQKNGALNGETLRQSFDTARVKANLDGVNVWTAADGVTLGQLATNQRSNETTAIPTLLQMLDLAGAVVTIDARGCQKERAAAIRKCAGDYVLAVRSNEHLRDDVQARFGKVWDGEGTEMECSRYQELTQGRGWKETCTTLVLGGAEGVLDAPSWQDLQAVCMVVNEQVVGAKSGLEARYYVGSLKGTAQEYAHAIRGHWGIRQTLHWVLDVQSRNDARRMRAAENLALVGRIAVSLLKNEKSYRRSSRIKSLRAGWDDDYLLRVLRGGFPAH